MKKQQSLVSIYTDGAIKKGFIGWGFVAIEKGIIIHVDYGGVYGDPEFLKQRNVAGELMAVQQALIWAGDMVIPRVKIVHDYKGCSAWPLEQWVAKNKYTQGYTEFVHDCMAYIDIEFELIKGHSGHKWNDLADDLAKAGAYAMFKLESMKHERKQECLDNE